MSINGDQIAGAIGMSLMALVLIQRLISREIPAKTILGMAAIWVAVILAAIVMVWLIRTYTHFDLT